MSENPSIEAKIKTTLDTEVRPAIMSHGGDVEFVSYDDGVVKVRLKGACGCCPGAMMTLKMGVEARLKKIVPEVTRVEAV